MDDKSSKYISELLKQLEELKRKKAHKERKLMKLKTCSSRSSQNSKSLSNSSATLCRKTDSKICQALKDENHAIQNCPENSGTVHNNFIENERFHSFQKEKNKENFDIKKTDLPPCEPNFATENNPNIEIGINKSIETVSFNLEQMKAPNTTDKIIKKMSLNSDTILTAESVIKDDCLLIIENPNKCLEHNITNKSPELTIVKSRNPESLDNNPLDCNMSCFISSDELLDSCNDKDKIIGSTNKGCESANHANYLKEAEVDAELIAPDHNISPSFSLNLSSNESQQINLLSFNFPKFSTPTDVKSDNTKTILNNFQEKCKTPRTSSNISEPSYKMSENDIIVPNENIPTFDKLVDHDVSKNKFDSSSLKFILGNGLSSVLDAHYGSPSKQPESKTEICHNVCEDNDCLSQQATNEVVLKKRKLLLDDNANPNLKESEFLDNSVLFSAFKDSESQRNKKMALNEGNYFYKVFESNNPVINEDLNFDNSIVLCSQFDSFTDSQNILSEDKCPENNKNLCYSVSSQVITAVDGLMTKVCENVLSHDLSFNFEEVVESNLKVITNNDNIMFDSEILVIPETEGLGLYFSKDTEEFLETSSLSQSFKLFEEKDNLLNMSSQSKLASPVVNNIVSALKSSKDPSVCASGLKFDPRQVFPSTLEHGRATENTSVDAALPFHDTLAMDASLLKDDTQELGTLKQVPYMSGENDQGIDLTNECKVKTESSLNFTCCLQGTTNDPIIDAEIVLFNDVKYAFLQHKTQIHVWRHEKNKKWVKIFCHQIEDMFSLDKMCVSMDSDNLVIMLLLSSDQNCCFQFLLFEKDVRVIKLMENTHWLKERYSKELVLLCGLDGLMFASAQNKGNHEVSLHAFISLKENPRLMTAILGTTDSMLCSLCKIDKLPNALMGVNDSMLYIWHILEARLVTAVSLHPHDYLPIKNCFWATVEKGLIYFMTTCEGTKDFQMCQLLAANLATGFCQSAMTYTTLPSESKNGLIKITKATYLEPFLVVAHSNGAFMWTVTEEFCCAALSARSKVTTVAISRDFENWGLLAIGSDIGFINCYSLN